MKRPNATLSPENIKCRKGPRRSFLPTSRLVFHPTKLKPFTLPLKKVLLIWFEGNEPDVVCHVLNLVVVSWRWFVGFARYHHRVIWNAQYSEMMLWEWGSSFQRTTMRMQLTEITFEGTYDCIVHVNGFVSNHLEVSSSMWREFSLNWKWLVKLSSYLLQVKRSGCYVGTLNMLTLVSYGTPSSVCDRQQT